MGEAAYVIEVARVEGRSAAPAEAFYRAWIDLDGHPEWSTCMEYLRLHEPFGVGARGELKSLTGDPAPFEVVAVEPPRVYADATILDGARLTVRHETTTDAAGTVLLITARLEGSRATEYARAWGDGVQRDIEADLASLTRLLERRAAWPDAASPA